MKYIITKMLTIIAVLMFTGISAFAQNYYVKADGNDTLDGKSDATAWKTVNKVNSTSFQAGDDVYFKCGDTWFNEQLKIDWPGTQKNRAIIGSYYGSGTIGVSGTRPVIDGRNVVPGEYEGLIQIDNADDTADYIKVENIYVKNSGGMGIRVNNNNDYIWVYNCKIEHTYKQGLDFYGTNYSVFEYSEVTDTNSYGGGSMVRTPYSNNCVIRHNTVHESSGWSEGINAYESTNLQIIGNLIYDTWAGLIYVDHGVGTVIKYNMMYYTANKKYWRYSDAPADGIRVADEKVAGLEHLTENITIYGNLIAAARNGIDFTSNPYTKLGLINTVIANNIVVEPYNYSIHISGSERHANSMVVNNIFYQPTGRIAKVPTTSKITFNYNLWSIQPEQDAVGINDIPFKDISFVKNSGWHNIGAGELRGADFGLQKTQTALSLKGLKLSDGYQYIIIPEESIWPNKIQLLDQISEGGNWNIGACAITTTVKKTYLLNTLDIAKSVIGASIITTTPTAPTNLKISTN